MTYKKVACKYGKCNKCEYLGYLMIAERPHVRTKQLINQKPNGTGARDGFNYGL